MKSKQNIDDSVRVEKAFLKRLFSEKKVPMVDLIEGVGRANQRKGRSYLESLLNGWSIGGYLFQVRRKGSDAMDGDFTKALEEPEAYTLVLNEIEEAEDHIARKSDWRAISKSRVEIDKGLISIEVQALDSVNVVGGLDEGMKMFERIRSFTQRVAVCFMLHDFDCIGGFLHHSWDEKGGVAEVEKRYLDLEMEHGGFELFDHVKVLSVYAGEGRDRKVFDEMALPKGVARSQRRGTSEFELVSRITPSGMPMLSARVFMEIIAEEGVFKITNLIFRSNL